jgi:hypothetical protein
MNLRGACWVGESTLRDWPNRGKAQEVGPHAEFYRDWLEATSEPNARAMAIVYDAMKDRPELAWKFIERRERGFAPPTPH